MREIPLLEVGGFAVGSAQDEQAATGCTVILFDRCTPVGVDIRGGGPASRETPLCDPHMAAKGLHALLLGGGSAYGLDAAGGVMRWLEEKGIGFAIGRGVVPLVSQTNIFDLGIGRWDVRPDAAMARAACKAASRTRLALGNAGVGMGCTVGKVRGPRRAMKSGLGAYAVQLGALKVGALVAVNAIGTVYELETGRPLAGLRGAQKGSVESSEEALWEVAEAMQTAEGVTNTTIGAVFTNAHFNKGELAKLAGMAHDGYARTIRPVHTMNDGDTIYAASVGELEMPLDLVGTLAAYVTAKAVNDAVRRAETCHDFPAMGDWLGA